MKHFVAILLFLKLLLPASVWGQWVAEASCAARLADAACLVSVEATEPCCACCVPESCSCHAVPETPFPTTPARWMPERHPLGGEVIFYAQPMPMLNTAAADADEKLAKSSWPQTQGKSAARVPLYIQHCALIR